VSALDISTSAGRRKNRLSRSVDDDTTEDPIGSKPQVAAARATIT
jgi:hypothetical protein